jgi:renin receptor
MFKYLLSFSALLALVFANGEISIAHSPSSIDFKGNERLESSTVAEVFSAALGYSVENPSGWGGLYINEPFNMPKAVVAIVVEGVEQLGVSQGKNPLYKVVGSTTSQSIDTLRDVVEQHDDVIEFDLNNGYDSLTPYADIVGEIKPTNLEKSKLSLKPQLHDEDKLFLQQLEILDLLSQKLSDIKQKPTLLIVRLSLSSLISVHGSASPAITDAMKLLSSAIDNLAKAAEEAYNQDAVVAIVVAKDQVSRSRREVTSPEGKQVSVEGLNLAKNYDEDYPAVFNIILWFGVAFTFSLLAICISIATMDPGRDSIIYRMTLNRLKKEN